MGKLLQFKRPEAYPQMERICEILERAPEGFTPQEISQAEQSARQIALAVAKAQLLQEAEVARAELERRAEYPL